MKASDIKDEDSLRLWLETRPQADSIAIAHRAALRAFPAWAAAMDAPWAREGDLTALPILRLNLISGVVRKFPTPEIKAAYSAARAATASAARPTAYSAARASAYSAYSAARDAAERATAPTDYSAYSATRAAYSGARAATASAYSAASATAAAWGLFRHDCVALEQGQSLEGTALWPNGENLFETEWEQTKTLWAREPNIYTFWLRWYQAALEGRSLNPELERDIALIPDAEWEKGAAHIAGLIALIEERYDLKAQVQVLRQQLTLAQAAAASDAHRGHNQPPELIDTLAEVRGQITIIFDALDEAEEEVSKPDPSPSRLERIGQKLLAAGLAIARYCGGLAHTALQKAAEELGTSGTKWAVRIGAASLAAEATMSLGKSLIAYAAKLLAGS